MYPATFDLLQALTNQVKAQLVIIREATPDSLDKLHITDKLTELNELLDKVQLELKGGT